MPRKHGSRDRNYLDRRSSLLAKIRARLVQPGGSRASLRDLAAACGITMPTLKHYFPDRHDLINSVMAEHLKEGAVHLEHVGKPQGTFEQSVREALAYTMTGFQFGGLGEVYSLGLVEGLRNSTVGPVFVELVLEPSIEAVKNRLDAHVALGDMRAVDTRHAAIALLSPVIISILHQTELGGSDSHPLDLDKLIDNSVSGFMHGYSIAPA